MFSPSFTYVTILIFISFISIRTCQSLTGMDTVSQRPPVTSADTPYKLVGYHPWWMEDAWRTYDLAGMDELIFFDLSVEAEGTFATTNGWPDDWWGMAAFAQVRDVAVVPTLTIFDTDLYVDLFTTPAHRDTLLHNVMGLVAEEGVGGVHLDFEIFDPVPWGTRDSLTAFVRDLRAGMDTLGTDLTLSMYMLAFDHENVFDEPALAEYVDYFVVQGYDLHWASGPTAGPISALDGWGQLNWQYVVARFQVLGVPLEKVVMSVPYFGYEWPTESEELGAKTRGEGQTLTYAPVRETGFPSAIERITQYGTRRDSVSGSPYYTYRDSTGWYQGWYEDAVSLQAKYEYVKTMGLGGVAIFPLSYGDATLEATLRDAFLEPFALTSNTP